MYRNLLSVFLRYGGLLLIVMAGQAGASEVKWITVERQGGHFDVRSELVVNAPLPEVYAALLNYDQFATLGDTFAESRYIEPADDGSPRIYTRTEGCIWFFCKTIERYARLEVEPGRAIRAIAEPEHSDAALSVETWALTADGDSTIIEYRHELETGFWVPPLLGALMINRSVEHGTQKAAVTIEGMATANRAATLALNQ
jgi:hypothetical protein